MVSLVPLALPRPAPPRSALARSALPRPAPPCCPAPPRLAPPCPVLPCSHSTATPALNALPHLSRTVPSGCCHARASSCRLWPAGEQSFVLFVLLLLESEGGMQSASEDDWGPMVEGGRWHRGASNPHCERLTLRRRGYSLAQVTGA